MDDPWASLSTLLKASNDVESIIKGENFWDPLDPRSDSEPSSHSPKGISTTRPEDEEDSASSCSSACDDSSCSECTEVCQNDSCPEEVCTQPCDGFVECDDGPACTKPDCEEDTGICREASPSCFSTACLAATLKDHMFLRGGLFDDYPGDLPNGDQDELALAHDQAGTVEPRDTADQIASNEDEPDVTGFVVRDDDFALEDLVFDSPQYDFSAPVQRQPSMIDTSCPAQLPFTSPSKRKANDDHGNNGSLQRKKVFVASNIIEASRGSSDHRDESLERTSPPVEHLPDDAQRRMLPPARSNADSGNSAAPQFCHWGNSCEEEFDNATSLNQHVFRTHVEPLSQIRCQWGQDCHESTDREHVLEHVSSKHVPVIGHGDKYVCLWEGCAGKFADIAALEHHVQSAHMASEEALHCGWDTCEAMVSSKTDLSHHVQDFHLPNCSPLNQFYPDPLGLVSNHPRGNGHSPGYSPRLYQKTPHGPNQAFGPSLEVGFTGTQPASAIDIPSNERRVEDGTPYTALPACVPIPENAAALDFPNPGEKTMHQKKRPRITIYAKVEKRDPKTGTLKPLRTSYDPDSGKLSRKRPIQTHPAEETLADDGPHICRWLLSSPDEKDRECGDVLESSKLLQEHVRDKHVGKIRSADALEMGGYTCRWAGCHRKAHQKFNQRSKLERHVKVHTAHKDFQCEFCGRQFVAQQALDQHRRRHTGEKPYECDFCSKIFAQSSALTMHRRTHTKERPLVCPHPGCGKRFSESSNLSKHRKTHKEPSIHTCQHCAQIFHRLDQLRRHQRNHHPTSNSRQYNLDPTVSLSTDNAIIPSLPTDHNASPLPTSTTTSPAPPSRKKGRSALFQRYRGSRSFRGSKSTRKERNSGLDETTQLETPTDSLSRGSSASAGADADARADAEVGIRGGWDAWDQSIGVTAGE